MEYDLQAPEPNPYEPPKEAGSIKPRPWFDAVTTIIGGLAALTSLLFFVLLLVAFVVTEVLPYR